MPKFLNKSNGGPCYKCSVRLLEEEKDLECEFQGQHKGRYLLDNVCEHLNLVERDYFGLRFVDTEKQRHWLDPVKSILKQIKDVEPVAFSFRVKFYPPNPFQLKEQITRYQIYLQLKRDLLRGRLYCNSEDAALLGAYILQAELGNYNPHDHVGNYASEANLFLKQSQSLEEEMMEIHQTEVKGQTLEEAEANFLRKASTLDSYGIDPFSVKDQKGNQVTLGVNYSGILVFINNRKVNHYRWNEVQKINYEGKMFIVHLVYMEDPRTKKKETVGFKCSTLASCKHIWRCSIEQMLFFTSASSSNVPRIVSGGGFFTGSKFRYTGRVEREVLEEMAQLSRQEPTITRVGSIRKKSSSVPATPSTPIINELMNFQDGKYNSYYRLYSCNLSENHENYNDEFYVDASTLLEPVNEDPEAKLAKKKDDNVDVACNNKNAVEVKINNVKATNGPNFKESFSEGALYCNREPMDQSSSDSHVTGSVSHRSSRSQTPVPKGNVHFSPKVATNERFLKQNRSYTHHDEHPSFYSRSCSFLKACLPAIILTSMSLLVVMVVAFETDAEFFALLRRAPEMVLIRREYYEPVKEQIRFLFNEFLKKIQIE